MAELDHQWAVAQLDAFLRIARTSSSQNAFGAGRVGDREAILSAAYVAEQVIERVLPDEEWADDDPWDQWAALRAMAVRAKTAIARQEELAEKLGDAGPKMAAGGLHPWAWESGKTLWASSHFNHAVVQAALRVNTETQGKVGRVDLSEVALFNDVFSLAAPSPATPRLRLMADDGSKTYQSLHKGARAFADGLYTGIRNPAMHTPTHGGDEQLALEQLAAFSLLARWVDQATVET